MELQEFVKETLLQIVSGVEDAQSALAERASTALVSPITQTYGSQKGAWEQTPWTHRTPKEVAFDVAVSATQAGMSEVGGKLSIFIAEASPNKTASTENSMTSRIKFSVPIVLPETEEKEPQPS